IESGKLELERHPLNLRDCIEGAIGLLAIKAAAKGIDLNYLIHPQTPHFCLGDPTRLRQILVNLLSNAIKFTETGEVMISVQASVASPNTLVAARSTAELKHLPQPLPESLYEIQFAIQDTGIGVPAQHLNRLFKSFSQVDASTTRQYGGTGLGLAISKQLSSMMGGRIWVESGGHIAGNPPPHWHPAPASALPPAPVGSTFYFTIVAPAISAQVLPVPPMVSQSGFGSAQDDRRLADKLPLRILLAEDHLVNQKVALLLLERLGYRADVATNGLEVLASLRRQSYDVVLMDVHMPEMDGLEASRQIRQEWPPPNRPRIIALTANAMQGDRQVCLDAGMDDYVSKPIQPEALLRALSQCQPQQPHLQTEPEPPMSHCALVPTSVELPAVDLIELQNLCSSIDSDCNEVLNVLVNCYLEESPKTLQAMSFAFAQADYQALNRAAHTLKGSSANLSATLLAQLCERLERMTSCDELHPETLSLFAQIEVEYERVKRTFQQICQDGI
ncbi:MAG TPA: response regulator, partial [Candidatus Obscuribacterales bacterium]